MVNKFLIESTVFLEMEGWDSDSEEGRVTAFTTYFVLFSSYVRPPSILLKWWLKEDCWNLKGLYCIWTFILCWEAFDPGKPNVNIITFLINNKN